MTDIEAIARIFGTVGLALLILVAIEVWRHRRRR